MSTPYTQEHVAALAAYLVATGWRKRHGGQFMHSYEHKDESTWVHLPIDTDKPWQQEHIADALRLLARIGSATTADILDQALNMKAIL